MRASNWGQSKGHGVLSSALSVAKCWNTNLESLLTYSLSFVSMAFLHYINPSFPPPFFFFTHFPKLIKKKKKITQKKVNRDLALLNDFRTSLFAHVLMSAAMGIGRRSRHLLRPGRRARISTNQNDIR